MGTGYGNRSASCSVGPGGCGEWEIADLEVVDAVVDAIPQPHRTAISFMQATRLPRPGLVQSAPARSA